MNSRKSIIPLDPVDLNGIQPRAEELVTEEVIGYLNSVNINTSLLSDDVPLRDEYTKFLSDLGHSPIRITNEDIDIGDSKSYFDELDLSNKKTLESEGLVIDKNYYISNRLWATNNIFGSTIFPTFVDYIPQLNQPKRTMSIFGKKVQTINMQFEYEPQQLASIPNLTLVK